MPALAALITVILQTATAQSEPTIPLTARYSASQRIAVLKTIATEIPANAVVIGPGTNIQSLVNTSPPGTTFLLKAGVHRLQSVVPKDGMSFYGQIGRDGTLLTTLSGAAVLQNADKSGSLYQYSDQKHKGGRVAFYGGKIFAQKGWEGSSYVEDVFLNDVPLKHVRDKTDVVSRAFYFDYDNDAIYLADDPAGKTVEVSTTNSAFSGSAKKVVIKGLIIEKYACSESGAVGGFNIDGWLIEGNEVRYNHTTGINLNNNCTARWNYAHHNGMIGIGVFEGKHRHVREEARKQGNNNLIEYNESSYNNYAHFDYHNQTAGIKNLVGTAVTIRGNFIHHNDARGIWLDVGTVGSVIEDNVIVSNSFSGIVVELGFDTVIRGNLVADNGGKMPGGVHGYQIVIQVSEDSDVYANTITLSATSGGGIVIEFAKRQAIPSRYTKNNYIHHNIIHVEPNRISADLYCYAKDLTPEEQENFFTKDKNRFDYNIYLVNKNDTPFKRKGEKLTLSQFREFGQESHGELRAQNRINVTPERRN